MYSNLVRQFLSRLCLLLLFLCFGLSLSADPVQAADQTAKIHIIALPGNSEAVLLETVDADGNPIFGLVDSGEDNAYPDGSDYRYPYRSGTIIGSGNDEQVFAYLESVGVTPDNLHFLVCTHPHSDHIGLAADLIRAYSPDIVYLPVYTDACISSPGRLWDNLFVYDRAISASLETEGVLLVQHLDPESEYEAEHPDFTFGNFEIHLTNYNSNYLETTVSDANQFSLGVIAVANQHTAFIPSDIDNTDGILDRILMEYDLTGLELLVSNHHGYSNANPKDYLISLSPTYYLQTGRFSTMTPETTSLLNKLGSKIYSAGGYTDTLDALIMDFSGAQAFCNADQTWQIYVSRKGSKVAYYNGKPYSGFFTYEDEQYYADDNGYLKTNTIWTDPDTQILYTFDSDGHVISTGDTLDWVCTDGKWSYQNQEGAYAEGWITFQGSIYYLDHHGEMVTGWSNINGEWYHFSDWGGLDTGWKQIDGYWYYLDPEQNGVMLTNQWIQAQSGLFYYLSSWGGALKNTVTKLGKYTYSFDENSCLTNIQWIDYNHSTYLLENSRPLTGWVQVGGSYYYLNEDGTLKKNSSFTYKGNLYYLDSDGRMASNEWHDINGKRYFFLKWGGALTNSWLKFQGKTYYLHTDGAMQVGWLKLEDKTYYFDEEGIMYTGKKTVEGKTYVFDSHGVLKA